MATTVFRATGGFSEPVIPAKIFRQIHQPAYGMVSCSSRILARLRTAPSWGVIFWMVDSSISILFQSGHLSFLFLP
ncbi:MAG: hypothetical protein M0Q01_14610 [Syntrophales bacterium]|jgi:hypothetical protein|nr:hypothetical protein [Syntrophales bacterium]